MPRTSGKRAAESEAAMDDDEGQFEDDDEDMLGSSGGDEDDDGEDDEEMEEAPEEPVGSPSPVRKKDMVLRSGRRKRRRSKETTGLTPPDDQKVAKRARGATTTTERKSKRKTTGSENGADDTPATDEAAPAASSKPPMPPSTAAAAKPTSRTETRTSARAPRESLLSTDHAAVATAQDPESSAVKESGADLPLEPPKDSNRRLFDAQPPDVATTAATATAGVSTADTPPVVQPPMNGEHDGDDAEVLSLKKHAHKALLWRIALSVLFFYPLWRLLWPVTVALSDYAVPLQEMTLPEIDSIVPTEKAETRTADAVAVDETGEDPPHSLQQSIETMMRLKERVGQRKESVQQSRKVLAEIVDSISVLLEEKKQALERSARLHEAETLLLTALDESSPLDAPVWHQVRESLNSIGQTVMDTTKVDLWQVEVPEGCSSTNVAGASSSTAIAGDSDPPVRASAVEEKRNELIERIMSSVKALIRSPQTETSLRHWIRGQIARTLTTNRNAAAKLAELEEAAKVEEPAVVASDDEGDRLNLVEIDEIVQFRLELESADRTGQYDHASIYNGARVIRHGKRETSPSLVDTLPLGNRLLHFLRLRFYGFGPEAAITPTYPGNALGQCWSFQQAPVKDLLKRRRSQVGRGGDDHKSGNLGTLTIALPTPVEVRSVVIEHPPRGITDQRNSAIRAFRIMGYEDDEAATKSWSLGSFEYDIESNASLQEFEVATEIFGKQVPPLQSISLAIDSNWGNDYACLYRFRVHGEEAEVDEDEDPFGP